MYLVSQDKKNLIKFERVEISSLFKTHTLLVDPLPQAFVQPQPLSYVFNVILSLSIILTKLTLIPFVNIGCVQKK